MEDKNPNYRITGDGANGIAQQYQNDLGFGLREMNFTKFFDVKSPVADSIPGNYNNAGIDLFMPRISREFLGAFLESNQPIYQNLLILKIGEVSIESKLELFNAFESDESIIDFDFEIIYKTLREPKWKSDAGGPIEITLVKYEAATQTFQFFERMQIPLGIAIEIPMGCYADLRSKSSNFKNGYFEITGLIDSCYTYGMGVQLIPFHGNLISINPKVQVDEKLTQIVLNQFVTIYNFVEYSQKDWDKKQEIINRREKRQGGFGSTGKFL